MKKLIIGLAIASAVASGNVLAQEKTGGSNAGTFAVGGVKVNVGGLIVAGVAVAGAIAANSSGSAPVRLVVVNPPPVDPTCSGDDALVDGVCIGTSIVTTVTGTGTGTMTTTISVPVTFTYSPSN